MFPIRLELLILAVAFFRFGMNDVDGYYVLPYGYDDHFEPFPETSTLGTTTTTTPKPTTTTTTPKPTTTTPKPTTTTPEPTTTTPKPTTTTTTTPKPTTTTTTTPKPTTTTTTTPKPTTTTTTPHPTTKHVCKKCQKTTTMTTTTTTTPAPVTKPGYVKYYHQYNYYYPNGPAKPAYKSSQIQSSVFINSVQNSVGDDSTLCSDTGGSVGVHTVNIPPWKATYQGYPSQPAHPHNNLHLHQSAPIHIPDNSDPMPPPPPPSETEPGDQMSSYYQNNVVTYLSDPSALTPAVSRPIVGYPTSISWQQPPVTPCNPFIRPQQKVWWNYPQTVYQWPRYSAPTYSATM